MGGKGGKRPLSANQTILHNIQLQSSGFGKAKTIVYGTQRVPGVLLDYTDFTAIKHEQQVGGKGGGGKGGSTQVTYTYTAAVIVGLCEGQITGLKNVWATNGVLALVGGSTTYTVPPGGGSYTPTIPSSGSYYQDDGVGYYSNYSFYADDYGSDGSVLYSGTQVKPKTMVGSPSGPDEYYSDGSGTYTFPSAAAGQTVVINYTFSVPDTTGNTTAPLTKLSLSLYTGARNQAPWGYMSSKHPDRALGYSGTAYVACPNMDLGQSGTLPNLTYEVSGLLQFGSGIIDANPADIAKDVITSPYHGTTFPIANLGDLTQWSNYCVANGLFLSAVVDTQQAAANTIDQLCKLTNTEAVWSEGKLKFVPYGDTTAVGNGVTFTPNTTPVYDLTDADFIVDQGTEPITISIVPPEEQYNVCKLEIVDRSNSYNPLPIEDKDDAAIQVNGLRTAQSITAHEITSSTVGKKVAMFLNRRTAYITRKFSFKLGLKYILLEPMDLVTVTDAHLGLNKYPVRILKIDEDENGFLTVEAEEFPWGTATATAYPAQSAASYHPDAGSDPGSVTDVIIFESTARLSDYQGYQINIGACGGDNWGGANVWISPDGTTYRNIATLNQPSRMGVLTATLPTSGTPVDTTDTLSVDLTESKGQLASGTASDCDNFRTLCYCDGELISYQTANLTSAYHYDLTTRLQRGVFGSTIGAHSAGTKFMRMDSSVLRYNYDPTWAGKTVYIKFTSFNIYGSNEQTLDSVPAYNYHIVGIPGAIDGGSGILDPGSLPPDVPKIIVIGASGDFAPNAWEVVLVDTTSGNVTAYMPYAAANVDVRISIKKVSADSHTVTIVPQTGDMIEKHTSLVLSYEGTSVDLVSDSVSNWNIV